MVENNSIIVLSHALTLEYKLSTESLDKLNLALKLFKEGLANNIIMAGTSLFLERSGPPNIVYIPRYDGTEEGVLHVPYNGGKSIDGYPVDGEAMKDYVVGEGVPPDKVLIVPYAFDTVGIAYFTNETILKPRNWLHNLVVTSKHNIGRSKTIFERVLGPNYQTDFRGSETEADNNTEMLEREKKSLKRFLEQFGDITPGDSRTIEDRLYKLHNFYSRIPEEERLRFYK